MLSFIETPEYELGENRWEWCYISNQEEYLEKRKSLLTDPEDFEYWLEEWKEDYNDEFPCWLAFFENEHGDSWCYGTMDEIRTYYEGFFDRVEIRIEEMESKNNLDNIEK